MIPLIVFLLACVAVYLGTILAAFSALMRFSLRMMAESAAGQRDLLGTFLEDPPALFFPARVLLGVVTVVVAVLLAHIEGVGQNEHGIWVFLASMLVFVFVCFLIVPQILVRSHPQVVLAALLPSFAVIARAFSPFTHLMAGVNGGNDRRGDDAPAAEEVETTTQAEVDADPSEDEGEARELFRSLVGFQDRLVREVMTPRPDIVAIRADASLGDLRARLRESEYSRLLVYRESLDDVVGFVHMKDVFLKGAGHDDAEPFTGLVRTAHVVPETKRAPELLKELQRTRKQTALVVDEYGGTAGLVTVEDLVEELVGEIRDEYDVEADPIVAEPDDTWVFSAKVDIDELTERLGVDIEREGFETIGGYLMSRLGRVPAVGEHVIEDGLDIEVLEAERRRVLKVRVRSLPAEGEE
ncbi:Hemolysin C [Luteitalea pratensis]|uniref:Hemolysin C n=1 Tax=Luteitalea pratensis TaxID=1855912 RepID=A0A143PQ71_LUTPR|nr:hemolysin family protein [Luteitalea pratensis]AMY09964.1 Hemolysin C [Luteitalea pratensis]